MLFPSSQRDIDSRDLRRGGYGRGTEMTNQLSDEQFIQCSVHFVLTKYEDAVKVSGPMSFTPYFSDSSLQDGLTYLLLRLAGNQIYHMGSENFPPALNQTISF